MSKKKLYLYVLLYFLREQNKILFLFLPTLLKLYMYIDTYEKLYAVKNLNIHNILIRTVPKVNIILIFCLIFHLYIHWTTRFVLHNFLFFFVEFHGEILPVVCELFKTLELQFLMAWEKIKKKPTLVNGFKLDEQKEVFFLVPQGHT